MFELAWPWIFVLAPLPWLLRRILPAARSSEAPLKVSFLAELEELAGRRANGRLPTWRSQAPFLTIWLLLLCAGARPQWVDEVQALPSSGRDLLLAVDVSGSMNYPDMSLKGQEVSRLDAVKARFGDFLEGRQGDRLGLILFGSQAYLQSPLTFDRHTVRQWLDEARIGIAGKNTALGDAIGLAVKKLRKRPKASRVLVLITDGANTAGSLPPLTAARLAAEQKLRIYTIGIGADPVQSGIANVLGLSAGLDLDEDSLKKIAEITDGQYFRARSEQDLKQIERSLDELERIDQATLNARPSHALHAWPLAGALLLSLFLAVHQLWPQWPGKVSSVYRRLGR